MCTAHVSVAQGPGYVPSDANTPDQQQARARPGAEAACAGMAEGITAVHALLKAIPACASGHQHLLLAS